MGGAGTASRRSQQARTLDTYVYSVWLCLFSIYETLRCMNVRTYVLQMHVKSKDDLNDSDCIANTRESSDTVHT